jgi:hypothetical protein
VLGIHAAKIRAHKMEDLIFKVEGAAAKVSLACPCLVGFFLRLWTPP